MGTSWPIARGSLIGMSTRPVVKINAIEVPPNAGPELEKRFAHRAHAVDNQPGFLGFQLLRPVKGEDRYFVVTQWESEEAFQAWANGPAIEAHAEQYVGHGHRRCMYWLHYVLLDMREHRIGRWLSGIAIVAIVVTGCAKGSGDSAAPASDRPARPPPPARRLRGAQRQRGRRPGHLQGRRRQGHVS